MTRARSHPKMLVPTIKQGGYLAVHMRLKDNGRPSLMSVHRLVAEAFLGPSPFPEAVVRHLDGERTNNRPQNLAWGTQRDNAADRWRQEGRIEEDLIAASIAYMHGISRDEICRGFGVSAERLRGWVQKYRPLYEEMRRKKLEPHGGS